MLLTYIVTLCFFLFILLIITLPQSHCQQQPAPPGYNQPCTEQPYNCGNLSINSYPFWGQNRSPYCGGGQPFKLNCNNNETTTISIQSQNFTVLNIDTDDHTIKMKRTDLDIDVCSPKFNDTYLSPNLFQYSQTVNNITIFYNCSSLDFPKSICESQNTAISYVGLEDDLLKQNASFRRCKRHIQLPAGFSLDPFHEKGDVIECDDLVLGLKEGFEVKYFVNEKCVNNVDDIDKLVKSCYYCQDGSIESATSCSATANSKSNPLYWKGKGKIVIGSGYPLHTTNSSESSIHIEDLPPNSPLVTTGVGSAMIGALLICIIIYRLRSKIFTGQVILGLKTKNDKDIEAFLKNHGALAQKRYKFSEVKKMTNSFKVKLGEGGFGAVYKGELLNGFPVAVKILKGSKGNRNGEEFINEVASISRTSHVNVVTLLGFCFEGCEKALIYEFMSKGSLDNFIYNRGSETIASLRCDNLYQIAKGIARGLEYLHRGCSTRILHFDIKPHNILLDENLCPKISDFGLAKLCPKKESIISMSDARGTMGYVAPEVWNRQFGGVSHKSDVYSYGMMLLEMVGGRKNINAEASHTSEIYYPYWVYTRLQLGSDLRPFDGVIVAEEDEIVRRMTIVGLWCIQTFPNDRPTMSKVIEMLEGNMNSLEVPPKPLFSSPTRSE